MDYATKTSLDPFFYFITQFLKAGPLKEYKRSAVQLLLICATSQIVRTLVAVAIQSLQGIIFLRWDLSAQTLNFAKVVSIKGDTFIPTSLATSVSSGLLWMVRGVSNLGDLESPSLARVRVISDFKETSPHVVRQGPTVLEDDEIPRGKKLLEKLQGIRVSIDEKVFSTAAEALKTSMRKGTLEREAEMIRKQ